VADCTRLPGRHRYIALMPQWDFLDFLAAKARQLHLAPPTHASFTLLRSTAVDGLLRERRRVVGVTAEGPDGRVEVRAHLTVACDGRHSDVRRLLGLRSRRFGAPMDVLWFRLPREATDPEGLTFVVGAGVALALIDRGGYFQIAYVIPKGGYEAVRAAGLEKLVENVATLAPWLAGRAGALKSWDDVHMLTVVIDRLRRWYAPGVLLIGDAAHAMSPMGGVGVNLAVQDAVAAARLVAPPLRELRDAVAHDAVLPGTWSLERHLAKVQARRLFPTIATQSLQRILARGVIARVLEADRPLPVPPFIRAMQRFPVLQGLTARAVAIGFLPEHVA
jgi:2-polyprenyl-6-methoxyphenol hydroxylase-like FAD-dependent oxidoreductase